MKLIFQILLLLMITFSVLGQESKVSLIQDTSIRKCKLRYPVEASRNRIEGTVQIKIIFDANCNIKDYEVVKSLGYGCDEAAIECIVNVQERIKQEKNEKCEDGYTNIYPFDFTLN